MRLERLRSALEFDEATQLAVQAVSRNVVDAAIEIANTSRHPLIISASCEQVDCEENGGGALDGWTTREFAEYVRERDEGGWVLICRDRAGLRRRGDGMDDALASLRRSLTADVEAGLDIIHIDASTDADGRPLGASEEVDLQTAIYAHAVEDADRLGYDVAFEIGGCQRAPDDDSLEGFEDYLDASLRRLDDTGLPRPLLVRTRIGTFVDGLTNGGRLELENRSPERVALEREIVGAVETASAYDAFVSIDGIDFLSPETLDLLADLGVRVAGVGPSMGVRETLSFIEMCDATRSATIRGDFLEAAFATRIWERLSFGACTATQLERAVMCGHHIFGTAAFQDFKARLQARLGAAGVDIDSALRTTHTEQIDRLFSRLAPTRAASLAG